MDVKRVLGTGAVVVVGILVILALFTALLAPVETSLKVVMLIILAAPVVLFIFRLFPVVMLALAAIISFVIILVININGLITGAGNVLNFIFDPASRQIEVIQCSASVHCSSWHPIIYSAILLLVVITGFAYTTLLERKLIGWFQHRVGPNRVGPWGLLQPAADLVKLVTKEDITPAGADYWVWFFSPMLKAVPTLIVLAVLPLGPDLTLPWFNGMWYQVPMHLADPNVGVLWLLAITSLGTYGVTLAGWSSNNKYAMLGGLRASAQMISYELSLGTVMAVPVMLASSLSVGDIVNAQNGFLLSWYVFQNPLAAAVLVIALIAEVNRAPFDLPEAEQELTAGFMTEYSGMKFATFMMGEYLGMIAVSTIAVSMFFGGYQDGFGLVNTLPILGPLVIAGKVLLCLCAFVWIRATLPRIRYDRLMNFGWKVMLPLALVAVAWTAVAIVIGQEIPAAYPIISGILLVVVVGGALYFLNRAGQVQVEEEDLADDPMVTGEQRGIGYAVLQMVGGILGILFAGYDVTVWILERLAKIGEKPQTAITPSESASKKTPAESSGGN
jgi:NADH-quinone oxidoreductase subunit H